MINQVFNGDCLELMHQIDDKSIDMILCDLPYGTTACRWDSVIHFEPLWTHYKRIIKQNGAIVLTASQPFTSALVMSNIKMFRDCLVWEKNISSNFLNANRRHMKKHEDIVIFYGKPPVYNKQYREGNPYTATRIKKDDTGLCYGKLKERVDTVNNGTRNPSSVLKFKKDSGLHPTQKPVALFEYLIKTYTNEGELVLDNCAGSGTTGIACKNTNRNFILMEKDEGYYNIIKERLNIS